MSLVSGLLFLVSCGGEKGKEISTMPPNPPASQEGEVNREEIEAADPSSDVDESESAVALPTLENPPTAAMAADMSGQELFANVCAACHGPKGEGNKQLRSPSIAGLPAWYTKIQIEKFQKDFRGTDAADPSGLQMHGIASILDAAATEKVADEIAKLELIAMTDTLGEGDPENGAEIFRERCMECHRFNGRGEIVFRSAPLIGFQDWYIVDQLKKYQAGVRGGHEEDIDGGKMHQNTQGMTGQQMKDVAAHLVELAEKYAEWIPRRERRLMEEKDATESEQ